MGFYNENDGEHVLSINGLTGDIVFVEGTNITFDILGNQITINSSGGSGGSQTLEQTLTLGNSTGGLSIISPDTLNQLTISDVGATLSAGLGATFLTLDPNDTATLYAPKVDINASTRNYISTPDFEVRGSGTYDYPTFYVLENLQKMFYTVNGFEKFTIDAANGLYRLGDIDVLGGDAIQLDTNHKKIEFGILGNPFSYFDLGNYQLFIGTPGTLYSTPDPLTPLVVSGDSDAYLETVVQNNNPLGTSDICAMCDNDDGTVLGGRYNNMGINNSLCPTDPATAAFGVPGDGYYYVNNGAMRIGTMKGHNITWFTGGTTASSVKMTLAWATPTLSLGNIGVYTGIYEILTSGTGKVQTTSDSTASKWITTNISDVYFGNGVTNATPISYTINGSGGVGNDIVAGNVVIAGGIGTGRATPSSVKIQTTDVETSSLVPQTLKDIHEWNESQSWSKLGQRIKRLVKSSDYTVTLKDYLISISGESAGVTISLPSAFSCPAGTTFVIKDSDGLALTYALKISPSAGDTIDLAISQTLTNRFQSFTLVSNGNKNWEII